VTHDQRKLQSHKWHLYAGTHMHEAKYAALHIKHSLVPKDFLLFLSRANLFGTPLFTELLPGSIEFV